MDCVSTKYARWRTMGTVMDRSAEEICGIDWSDVRATASLSVLGCGHVKRQSVQFSPRVDTQY